jgi:hypothetical protein
VTGVTQKPTLGTTPPIDGHNRGGYDGDMNNTNTTAHLDAATILDIVTEAALTAGIDLDGVESALDIYDRIRDARPAMLDEVLPGHGSADPTITAWLKERSDDIDAALCSSTREVIALADSLEEEAERHPDADEGDDEEVTGYALGEGVTDDFIGAIESEMESRGWQRDYAVASDLLGFKR